MQLLNKNKLNYVVIYNLEKSLKIVLKKRISCHDSFGAKLQVPLTQLIFFIFKHAGNILTQNI